MHTLAAIRATKAECRPRRTRPKSRSRKILASRAWATATSAAIFPKAFDEVWLDDDDGMRRRKILGNPELRRHLLSALPGTPPPQNLGPPARISPPRHCSSVPSLGDTLVENARPDPLGVGRLKLQGGEYPPRLLGKMIRGFRFVIDGIQGGRTDPADIQTMLLHLRSLRKEEAPWRMAHTAELHDALEARLAAKSA